MGRQVFTAGEILTAANMNDLSDQSVMVFDDDAARTTAIPTPVEGMVTYLKTDDEVTVFDGSAFKAVGPGKILQVVQTVVTVPFTTASGTFTDITDYAVTITPSSATSNILVVADYTFQGNSGSSALAQIRLLRDAGVIYAGTNVGSRIAGLGVDFSSGLQPKTRTAFFLDNPATTSAITYKAQLRTNFSPNLAFFNRSQTDTDNTDIVRPASSITVIEVAG